jgi:U3 small nucleolar RNA-associated protein 15
LLHSLPNFSKAVTCLALNSSRNELWTGSLDHHLKTFDLSSYKVLSTTKYPAPLLSLGISDDSKTWAVGMSNGLLSVHHEPTKASSVEATTSFKRGSWAYFMRGSLYQGTDEQVKIKATKSKKLAKYDYYLKTFQYANALDNVIENKSAVLITSVLRELVHRDGLMTALGGRDEKTLEPIIAFLCRYMDHPKYASLLMDVTLMILEMYKGVMTRSMVISDLLMKLRQKVKQELMVQQKMMQVTGIMESLFSHTALLKN